MKTAVAQVVVLLAAVAMLVSAAPSLWASASDCATTMSGTTTSGKGATQKDSWNLTGWCSGSGCARKLCGDPDGSAHYVCTNDDTCDLPACCKLILQIKPPIGVKSKGLPRPEHTGNCTTSGCTTAGVCRMRVTRPKKGAPGAIQAQPECTTAAGLSASLLIGSIWNDGDGDGEQDASEAGVPGVLVMLIEAGGDEILLTSDDIIVGSTQTASDGSFEFEDFAFGYYRIEAEENSGPLVGMSCTTDNQPLHIVLYGDEIREEGAAFGYR